MKKYKKIAGAVLIAIGIASLLTPFTPGSWLIFVGLEILGIRLLWWNRIKARLGRRQQNTSHPLGGGDAHQE